MVSVFESATVKRRITSGLVAGAFFALQMVPMFTMLSGSASAQVLLTDEVTETQTTEATGGITQNEVVDQVVAETENEEVTDQVTTAKTVSVPYLQPQTSSLTSYDDCTSDIYSIGLNDQYGENEGENCETKKSYIEFEKKFLDQYGDKTNLQEFVPKLDDVKKQWNTQYNVTAGDVLALSESMKVSGYKLQYIYCFDKKTNMPAAMPYKNKVVVVEGQTVVCRFVNKGIRPGLVLTKKVVNEQGNKVPSTVSENFTFKVKVNGKFVKNVTIPISVGDDESVHVDVFGALGMEPRVGDKISIHEVAVEGWELNSVKCWVNGKAKDGASRLRVKLGVTYDCIFKNQHKPKGKLIVTKDARPNSDQDFPFVVSRTCERPDYNVSLLSVPAYDNGYQPHVCVEEVDDFLLDDDDDTTLSNTNAQYVKPGVYTITENGVDGWKLADISCGEAQVVNRTATSVTVKVEAGQTVHCTFMNEKVEEPKVLGETTTPKVSSVSTLADTGETSGVRFSLMAIAILIALSVTTVRTREQQA